MIAVIGLGFIGLTTALGFCDKGYTVYGIDSNLDRINLLKNGSIPFHEPYLHEKLQSYLNSSFMITNLREAIDNAKIVFICVGTDSKDEGTVSLDAVQKVVSDVLKCNINRDYITFVIRSTVPPILCEELILDEFKKHNLKLGLNVGLAFNPEFLREGYAWGDFINPDRIVIGVEDEISKTILGDIFYNFFTNVHFTNFRTACFIKYLSNTMLATMISFANEASMIAMSLGEINIKQAFNILHEDSRFKVNGVCAKIKDYIFPGCGFGGYCLPKDIQGILMSAKMYCNVNDYNMPLLNAVVEVNDKIVNFLLNQIYTKIVPGSTIAILGLSFKPNTDDVRFSVSCKFISSLLAKGYNVIAHDPIAISVFKEAYPNFNINYESDIEKCICNAHASVVLTAWDEYRSLNYDGIVFDFRYMLENHVDVYSTEYA